MTEQKRLMRWYVLLAAYRAQPIGVSQIVLERILSDCKYTCTSQELQILLDDLQQRGLIKTEILPTGHYHTAITVQGTDIVEYTADAPAAVLRPPQKYPI